MKLYPNPVQICVAFPVLNSYVSLLFFLQLIFEASVAIVYEMDYSTVASLKASLIQESEYVLS